MTEARGRYGRDAGAAVNLEALRELLRKRRISCVEMGLSPTPAPEGEQERLAVTVHLPAGPEDEEPEPVLAEGNSIAVALRLAVEELKARLGESEPWLLGTQAPAS